MVHFPFVKWSVSSEEEVAEQGTIVMATVDGVGTQQLKTEGADSVVESELEVFGCILCYFCSLCTYLCISYHPCIPRSAFLFFVH